MPEKKKRNKADLQKEANAYLDEVASQLCIRNEQLTFVLTAVANAVQERLGQDIILVPQVYEEGQYTEDDLSAFAMTYDLTPVGGKNTVTKHYIIYGLPPINKKNQDERILKITLDVAHELGHLMLQNGYGHLPKRTGIVPGNEALIKKELEKIIRDPEKKQEVLSLTGDDFIEKVKEQIQEIEADWMAICLLQMYGYIYLEIA